MSCQLPFIWFNKPFFPPVRHEASAKESHEMLHEGCQHLVLNVLEEKHAVVKYAACGRLSDSCQL
jgi:hypothetical protein